MFISKYLKTLDLARFRRLLKEGSWVVFGQVVAFSGALAQVKILTEYLEPSQYGQLALGLTIATLINQSVMAGVTPGIGRFYAVAAERNDTSAYMYASQKMMSLATLFVIFLAFVLVGILIFLDYEIWICLTLAAFAYAIFSAYSGAVSSVQNAARQRSVVAIHNGLNAWLMIGLAVLCLIWLGSTSASVAIGFAISTLLITSSQLIFLRRLIGPWYLNKEGLLHNNWSKEIWTYSTPFLIWGLFGWAQQSSSRWALGLYSSTSDVGFFAVLSQLGYAPLVLLTTLSLTFLTPILFARAGDATDTVRNANVSILMIRMILGGIFIAISATTFTYFFHEQIFRFLVNEKYWLNSYYLPYMTLAGGVFSTAQVVATLPMSLNRPKKLLGPSIISSLVGIITSFVGVYYFSIQGAVSAMLIHSCTYFILCCFGARQAQQESLERHIDEKKI